jgi:transcriptional regulator with XRE-family HTH domain
MSEHTKQLTLADLVRDHQDRTGDSYSMIAHRAGLSKAKIGQLANVKATIMPRTDTLERLAKGLNLPFKTVQQAAMTSAGITPEGYPGGDRMDLIVESLRELSPDDLETVSVVIQSLKDRRTLRAAS